jgi:hypothetical protein
MDNVTLHMHGFSPRRGFVVSDQTERKRRTSVNANRMGVLDLSCYAIGCLPELCTEDEQELYYGRRWNLIMAKHSFFKLLSRFHQLMMLCRVCNAEP